MKKLFLSFLFAVVGFGTAKAQYQGNVYTEDTSIKVMAYGQEKKNAWCGGMSNPQFAVADLNHDGLNDLVIFEWGNQQVKTFINKGSAGNPDYVYAPHYIQNFPACNDYLKLEDYNQDGTPDLIIRGYAGFEAHKGYYNSHNKPYCFDDQSANHFCRLY
jgi:hypothetical protein